MSQETQDSAEIRDTDIIFDCPCCAKSLAIDYRGAGLTIPCTDCGKHVQVPIPEGMDITDIDSTKEEQEARILSLRKTLSSAEERIEELETALDEVNARRDVLEKDRAENVFRLGVILEKVETMKKALSTIAKVLKHVSEVPNDDPGDRSATDRRPG